MPKVAFRTKSSACTDTGLPIAEPRVLLVNSSWLPEILYELDRQPNANVVGLLVLPDGAGNQNLDSQQPQAAFAPYNDHYIWNRGGNGGLWRHREFPVQVLDKDDVAGVLSDSHENSMKASSALPYILQWSSEYSTASHMAIPMGNTAKPYSPLGSRQNKLCRI